MAPSTRGLPNDLAESFQGAREWIHEAEKCARNIITENKRLIKENEAHIKENERRSREPDTTDDQVQILQEQNQKLAADIAKLEAENKNLSEANTKLTAENDTLKEATKRKANANITASPSKKQKKDTNTTEQAQLAIQNMPEMPLQVKPVGLRNPLARCFANSAMQALATAIHADWLKSSMGGHWEMNRVRTTRQSSPTRSSIYSPIDQFLKTLDKIRDPNPPDSFYDSKAMHDAFAKISDEFKHLKGDKQQDPAEWLRLVLNCLSQGSKFPDMLQGKEYEANRHKLVDSLFRVKTKAIRACGNKDCGDKKWDEGGDDWMLNLTPAPGSNMTINELLENKLQPAAIEGLKCGKCGLGKPGVRDFWKGLESLPEHLVIRFDRATWGKDGLTKKKFGVQIKPTLDVINYVLNFQDDGERTQYALRSIIAHIGETPTSGHYIAYTQDRDGTWWLCNDRVVTEIAFDKISFGEAEGDAYMVVYQRLP